VLKFIGYLGGLFVWLFLAGMLTLGMMQVHNSSDEFAGPVMSAAVGAWGALPVTGAIALIRPQAKLMFWGNLALWTLLIVVLSLSAPGHLR
jgi:hypothetical protein